MKITVQNRLTLVLTSATEDKNRKYGFRLHPFKCTLLFSSCEQNMLTKLKIKFHAYSLKPIAERTQSARSDAVKRQHSFYLTWYSCIRSHFVCRIFISDFKNMGHVMNMTKIESFSNYWSTRTIQTNIIKKSLMLNSSRKE
jgi:hypothetical protein